MAPAVASDVAEIHGDFDWDSAAAATLSGVGFPVAVVAVYFYARNTGKMGSDGVTTFARLTPMFSGLGQLYAGDGPRALAVGTGMLVCFYGSWRLFGEPIGIDGTGSPYNGGMDNRVIWAVVGYSVFAAWDAYQTVNALRAKRSIGVVPSVDFRTRDPMVE